MSRKRLRNSKERCVDVILEKLYNVALSGYGVALEYDAFSTKQDKTCKERE
jgi:hypothetical protein